MYQQCQDGPPHVVINSCYWVIGSYICVLKLYSFYPIIILQDISNVWASVKCLNCKSKVMKGNVIIPAVAAAADPAAAAAAAEPPVKTHCSGSVSF